MQTYDVIIIGAGAAGLRAARACVGMGRRTLILDMGDAIARKVRVSGGGRCNITNAAAARDRYFGQNPDFVRSALAAVTPDDILDWAAAHHLPLIEKAPGQYFCADGATAVVGALGDDARGTDILSNTCVTDMDRTGDTFRIHTDRGDMAAPRVIIATGGVSYPNLGVSDIGYKIAKKFGHKIVPPRPGLVALDTDAVPADLAGIGWDVQIHIGRHHITDAMMFRHHGIGGPAAYRASLYDLNDGITIDLLPGASADQWLRTAKQTSPKKSIQSILAQKFPARMAAWLYPDKNTRIAEVSNKILEQIAASVHKFYIPGDRLRRAGFSGAEVTYGGVDTADISSKTMESKLCPGLFFAGEVLDITGDLGGFNLHFAWASGTIAGRNAAQA